MKQALSRIGYGFLGAVLFALLAGGVAVALDPTKGIELFRLDGSRAGQSWRLRLTDGFLQPGFNGQDLTLGAGPQVVLDADETGCFGGTDDGLCATIDLRDHTVLQPTVTTAPSGSCTIGDRTLLGSAGSGTAGGATGAQVYNCEDADAAGSGTTGAWVRQGRVFQFTVNTTLLSATAGDTQYFGVNGRWASRTCSTDTTKPCLVDGDCDGAETCTTLQSTASTGDTQMPYDNMTVWAACCAFTVARTGGTTTMRLENSSATELVSITYAGASSEYTKCTTTNSGWSIGAAKQLRWKYTHATSNTAAMSAATCTIFATAGSGAGL